MCGIIGQFSIFSRNLSEFKPAQELLYVDGLRGQDSTGVALYSRMGRTLIHKEPVPALDFLSNLEKSFPFTKGFTFYNGFLGHNRFATSGKIDEDSAHPFQEDNIILCHNGTLNFGWNKLPGASKAKTDSHAIALSMAQVGGPKTIEQLSGSFSLVWLDTEQNTLNFCRNDERPMSFVTDENHSQLFFASEAGMLKFVLGRLRVQHGTIVSPKPGALISFDLTAQNFQAYKHKMVKFKEPRTVIWSSSASSPKNHKRTSIKSRQKIVDGLAKHGLRIGDQIDFLAVSMAKKKGNGKGRLDGLYEYDNHTVLIHCHDQHLTTPLDKTYSATIVDMINIGAKDEAIVVAGVRPQWARTPFLSPERRYLPAEELAPTKPLLTLLGKVEPEPPSDSNEATPKLIPGPKKTFLDLKTWDKMTREGCCSCGDNIDVHDADRIIWINNAQPMCPNCIINWREEMGDSLVH